MTWSCLARPMSPPLGETTSSKNTLATEKSLEINNADAHPAADDVAIASQTTRKPSANNTPKGR